MWPNDQHFSTVLASASLAGLPFRRLPEELRSEDVRDPAAMPQQLRRVFHVSDGAGKEQVLIWALARPYRHSDGLGLPSTIVYIEKMAGSVRGRWPLRYLRYLATDYAEEELLDADDLRTLAARDRNYSFYSRVVQEFGPLSLWIASAEELNRASGLRLATSREWEHRLLCKYMDEYGCFPLKNRRR